MPSPLVSRALPAAGGALTALALGVALTHRFSQDALQLTGRLGQASDQLVQLDLRIRHPDVVAEQERQQRLVTQVHRFRPLHRLRDDPTVSEEVTARFSVRLSPCAPGSTFPVPPSQPRRGCCRGVPLLTPHVAAAAQTYVADGMSSLTHFNAALALDAAYKRVRSWMQHDQQHV